MRIRLRAFGVTVASLTFDSDNAPPETEPDEPTSLGGGSCHNFERAPEVWDQPDDGRAAGFGFS